jgi:spore coat polysaccharide biosynthesis protein SpsF (cytidylyltransferase family)
MKIIGIIQARIQSTRLPGKVLYELGGLPVLGLILRRLKRCRNVDEFIVATGDRPQNSPIMELAKRFGVRCFIGSEDDVLDRFARAADFAKADGIVRVTADCPFSDRDIIDHLVAVFLERNYDFVTNVKPPTWPDGLDVSVFKRSLLDRAAKEAAKFSERQHVVPWMWDAIFDHPLPGLCGTNVPAPEDLSRHRWVIDEPKDYIFFNHLLSRLRNKDLVTIGWKEILAVLKDHPELLTITDGIVRDEGLLKDLKMGGEL